MVIRKLSKAKFDLEAFRKETFRSCEPQAAEGGKLTDRVGMDESLEGDLNYNPADNEDVAKGAGHEAATNEMLAEYASEEGTDTPSEELPTTPKNVVGKGPTKKTGKNMANASKAPLKKATPEWGKTDKKTADEETSENEPLGTTGKIDENQSEAVSARRFITVRRVIGIYSNVYGKSTKVDKRQERRFRRQELCE
ncbi:hypothetical protein HYALB_00009669 [Hymenoscyphus albidus]|uniref:Uncharacterized protein n=1 Tax=Hymenoscyphus albidus TaxID=595503 RepID=A0A9N9Q0W5_9HELO|nr:hypothetical protein HYALB_00009669 [Hymenoscyphus albidus]